MISIQKSEQLILYFLQIFPEMLCLHIFSVVIAHFYTYNVIFLKMKMSAAKNYRSLNHNFILQCLYRENKRFTTAYIRTSINILPLNEYTYISFSKTIKL